MTSTPPAERRGEFGAVDPTAPMPGFPQHLPALTSVRFWLALGVVLFHYQLNILPEGAAMAGLIERARLAVDFFFILSGFVLAHVYGASIRSGAYSHKRFLVARFARIYPMHFAMLGVMAVVALMALALNQPFDRESYTVPGFLSALALVHAWFPATTPNEWNGPSWSLSAEWAAYLAFPIFTFIGLRRRSRPWLTIAIAVALFVALDAYYRSAHGTILTHAELVLGVLRIIPEFLFGIGLYQLGSSLRVSTVVSRWAAAVSVAALLLMMSFSADERLTVLVAGVVILSLALLSRSGSDKPFAHPLALEAGEASYALYLVHLPMLVIWKNTVAMMEGVDSSYRMTIWEAGILLVFTIAAAFVMHSLWERPARRWIRRRLLGEHTSPSSSQLPPL